MDERRAFILGFIKEFKALVSQASNIDYSPFITEVQLQSIFKDIPGLTNLNIRIMTKAYFLYIREYKSDITSPSGLTSPTVTSDPVIDLLRKEFQSKTTGLIDSVNVFSTEGKETKSSLVEAVFTYYQILKISNKR